MFYFKYGNSGLFRIFAYGTSVSSRCKDFMLGQLRTEVLGIEAIIEDDVF